VTAALLLILIAARSDSAAILSPPRVAVNNVGLDVARADRSWPDQFVHFNLATISMT
jgi:hypothetical protein